MAEQEEAEAKLLVERLVGSTSEDHDRFLRRLKNRFDRVGMDLPAIEVRVENLEVEAKAYTGSRASPTILNSMTNTVWDVGNALHVLPSRKTSITILQKMSAIIKPGRMTLLLGSPGSGKSIFLKALAGKLDSSLKVSGRVTYNGYEMEEFAVERTAAYIGQDDLHTGEMTVRETLAFSARCQGAGTRHDLLSELLRREKEANVTPEEDIDMFMKAVAMGGESHVITDYVLKILGLEICADTLVGDDMLRGISGGQRKRVTIGEMLVGPARALFMDEISTGLDSSTTFTIVNYLRQSIQILNGTAVISLLQPAPETFDLFDDVILLSEGCVVYHGPREHAVDFFESVGFRCPERKSIADFLLEVTSRKDQQQYWARDDEPYNYIMVAEFAEAFGSFHVVQAIAKELEMPFDKKLSHLASLTISRHDVNKREVLKATFAREILLMRRNSLMYIFNVAHLAMVAFMAMTIFWRGNMHHDSVTDGGIYLGALFFAVAEVLFSAFGDLGGSVMRLPIFYKQRDVFYPAWVYSLPIWILKIPITVVEVTIWVAITYYAVGLDPNVGRFFKHYLLLLAVSQMASSLFRFIGGVTRDMVVANTFSSFVLLILFLLSGFILSSENVNKFWMLGYWISPFMYAQNAISTNEFTAQSWRKMLPGLKESLGITVLKSHGLFSEEKWYWIGFVALVGYTFLFNGLYTASLTCFNPSGRAFSSLPGNVQREKHVNSTGELQEVFSKGSHHKRVNSKSPNSTNKIGIALQFVPLLLTFDNIRYSADMPKSVKVQGKMKDRLEILKGVSGSFRPGVLTALMGVSGAGKTSLMDVLAGRKTGGYTEGTIAISGYPKKQEAFSRVFGYCEQMDVHSPHMTILESLVFSAWLRLPSEIGSVAREVFVEDMMELLELTSLRDAPVGLPGVNGLSSEQRKRLTIAVELVANPSIIFMDEPTSGLDAQAAAIMMRTVRTAVEAGKTVVCTIHQPSIDIFESFDELLLLNREGEEIYVGPLGHHSSELIKYFEGLEGTNRIKYGDNPATWMLEVSSRAQEEMLGVNFSVMYKNSELYQKNKALIREQSTPSPGSSDLQFPTQYSQPFFTQCFVCLWKQNLSYWRNPPYNAVRYFFTAITALLFGTIFWNLGTKREKRQDIFNSVGSMYCAILMLGVQNSSSVQPVVAMERTVFYRERAAGMYSPLPYAFGQVAIEVPYVFIQVLIYGVIVYTMIGFEWTPAKFFWYMFFMYFTILYFTFFGMMAVGLAPNYSIAAIVSSAIYAIWNLFSGFLIPVSKIPIWWRWNYWICPTAWTLYGLAGSQFGDVEGKLDSGETVAEFVRGYFGFKHEFIGLVAMVIIAYAVVFAFLYGFTLKNFNFQKR